MRLQCVCRDLCCLSMGASERPIQTMAARDAVTYCWLFAVPHRCSAPCSPASGARQHTIWFSRPSPMRRTHRACWQTGAAGRERSRKQRKRRGRRGRRLGGPRCRAGCGSCRAWRPAAAAESDGVGTRWHNYECFGTAMTVVREIAGQHRAETPLRRDKSFVESPRIE